MSIRDGMSTYNNCAGGITPWGTWLMSEKNINFYFMGENADADEAVNHELNGAPGSRPYPCGYFLSLIHI